MMKCHEDEKAESHQATLFSSRSGQFSKFGDGEEKTGGVCPNRREAEKPPDNKQTKEQPGCQQTQERVEWLSRELVEMKLEMMGSDEDDDVFSLVEFRGQSWHGISTTTTTTTLYYYYVLYTTQLSLIVFMLCS